MAPAGAPWWPTTPASWSRRWAARPASTPPVTAATASTTRGRVTHLLAELGDAADRRAAFVCVLVAIAPDGSELVARAASRAPSRPAPRGAAGFGYDPIFVPAGETRTIGEMTAAEKDALSHRGRAAAVLRAALRR